MQYLLDTNICIYLIKQKSATILKRFQNLSQQDAFLSSISIHELQYGVYKSQAPEKNLAALEAFTAFMTVLPFNIEHAEVAGKIRAMLAKKGTPIGPYDTLIAAQALHEGFILVTNNVKEFERIDALKLENWAMS